MPYCQNMRLRTGSRFNISSLFNIGDTPLSDQKYVKDSPMRQLIVSRAPSFFSRAPPKPVARPRDPAFNAINVDDSDYEDTFQVSVQPLFCQTTKKSTLLELCSFRSRRQCLLCLRSATGRCRASSKLLRGKNS